MKAKDGVMRLTTKKKTVLKRCLSIGVRYWRRLENWSINRVPREKQKQLKFEASKDFLSHAVFSNTKF